MNYDYSDIKIKVSEGVELVVDPFPSTPICIFNLIIKGRFMVGLRMYFPSPEELRSGLVAMAKGEELEQGYFLPGSIYGTEYIDSDQHLHRPYLHIGKPAMNSLKAQILERFDKPVRPEIRDGDVLHYDLGYCFAVGGNIRCGQAGQIQCTYEAASTYRKHYRDGELIWSEE